MKIPCKISKKFKFVSRSLIRVPFLLCTCVNYSLILVMFAVAHPVLPLYCLRDAPMQNTEGTDHQRQPPRRLGKSGTRQ